MEDAIEIKDAQKDLEIHLGAEPYQHYIKVNGMPWTKVLELTASTDATKEVEFDQTITFTCFLDDPFCMVGRLTPEGEKRAIDVQLRLNGRLSRCAFDGKEIRFRRMALHADATRLTTLTIEQLLPPARPFDEPVVKVIQGVFIPVGEQTITNWPLPNAGFWEG